MLIIKATTSSELAKFYKRRAYYEDGAGLVGIKYADFIRWHRMVPSGDGFSVTGSTLTPEGARRYLLKKED